VIRPRKGGSGFVFLCLKLHPGILSVKRKVSTWTLFSCLVIFSPWIICKNNLSL
jgi:hypothetical protein